MLLAIHKHSNILSPLSQLSSQWLHCNTGKCYVAEVSVEKLRNQWNHTWAEIWNTKIHDEACDILWVPTPLLVRPAAWSVQPSKLLISKGISSRYKLCPRILELCSEQKNGSKHRPHPLKYFPRITTSACCTFLETLKPPNPISHILPFISSFLLCWQVLDKKPDLFLKKYHTIAKCFMHVIHKDVDESNGNRKAGLEYCTGAPFPDTASGAESLTISKSTKFSLEWSHDKCYKSTNIHLAAMWINIDRSDMQQCQTNVCMYLTRGPGSKFLKR